MSWRLLAALTLVAPACNNTCSPDSTGRHLPWPIGGGGADSTCDDAWHCGTGTFEVRCTGWAADAGGWQSCECVNNGRVERQLSVSTLWCSQGGTDAYERILDANAQCGWALPYGG
jgi:hypothetical protein